MKKNIITISAFALATMGVVSCQKMANVPTSVAEVKVPSKQLNEIKVDSVVVDTVWDISDKDVLELIEEGMKPGLHCRIDVPSAEQNPILANAIMEWVNEDCMFGLYDGEMLDAKKMVTDFAKYMASGNDEGNIPDAQTDVDIRKVYENQYVVTFVCTKFIYNFGAPHGQNFVYGATFRKSDGKVFGWNMISGKSDLQPILKAGLMKYFDVRTDEELSEMLMIDSPYSIEYLPRPEVNPWVTKDGIMFQYQSYEIGSYAAGMPEVVVPVKELQGALTETAKKIL